MGLPNKGDILLFRVGCATQEAISNPGLYFKEGDKIEEGEFLAVFLIVSGTCEAVALAFRTPISLPCVEGDSAISEDVMATFGNGR